MTRNGLQGEKRTCDVDIEGYQIVCPINLDDRVRQ
jgi:hypothetical protein